MLFFCLDAKETKNQGCIKMAKICFTTLQGKSLKPSISIWIEPRLMKCFALNSALSLLDAPFRKFLYAIFIRPITTPTASLIKRLLLIARIAILPSTPVIAKGTSAGWLPSEGEDIPIAAKRFRKQAGGVPLQ
jgi:hypothetical protein